MAGLNLQQGELCRHCRGFDRTAVDKPPISELSQSEALQSVTAYQSLKLRSVLSLLEA